MGLLDVFKKSTTKQEVEAPQEIPHQTDPSQLDLDQRKKDMEAVMTAATERDQLMTPRGISLSSEQQQAVAKYTEIKNPFRNN